MMRKKNTRKNRYQIFTIGSVILAAVYAYALYNAIQAENRSKIFMYGAISLAWIILAYYWMRSAAKEEE